MMRRLYGYSNAFWLLSGGRKKCSNEIEIEWQTVAVVRGLDGANIEELDQGGPKSQEASCLQRVYTSEIAREFLP